jgi:hypothetical protein
MFETEGFLQNSWVNHCWSYPGISCGTSAWIWKSRQRPWPKASHLAWHGGSQVIIQISSSNFAFFLPFWWGHRNRWWFSDIPRAVTKALRWRAQPLWSPEITGPNISGFPYSDTYTGWWFGTFFIFPNSWDDDPIWLINFQEGWRLKPPISISVLSHFLYSPTEFWPILSKYSGRPRMSRLVDPEEILAQACWR